MNKYQKFILERTLCFVSKDMEAKDKQAVTNFLNDKDEFVVQQDENYNVKKTISSLVQTLLLLKSMGRNAK